MNEHASISRERLEKSPGEVYTRTVLKPSYDFMLDNYFEELLETNKAWTVMLSDCGIITDQATKGLVSAIRDLEQEGREGMGAFDSRYEYFYSTMEAYLIRRAGEEIAGEINIGRTRPEPLARMALRERLLTLIDRVNDLRAQLLAVAAREATTVIPMGTHMQHAQVATVGHYLLGLIDRFDRDVERLLHAYKTTNQCTLGCGALVGSSYPIDRELVAHLLGFDGIVENTNDCVGAGDYMLEGVSAIAGTMIGLSRLCQDLYTWHTQEFSYLTIGDDYSGSSSMMPQKKNPYPFEYARTAAAHIVGDMNGAFSALHNTNYQDIKDVEEGLPPPVFRACDSAAQMLELITGVMATAAFDTEVAYAQAATHFASCTELAARIHRETDVSMRTAHRVVGNLVLRAMKAGQKATEVGAETLNASALEILGRDLPFDDEFVASALEPTRFVEAHDLIGGPSQRRVEESLARARESLTTHQARVQDLRDALARSRGELADRVRAKAA